MLSLSISKTSFLHIIIILAVTGLVGCDRNSPNEELPKTDQPPRAPLPKYAVSIKGEVTQALPTNTAINVPYPVAFRFTNVSKQNATKVTLSTLSAQGFTETVNSCGKTLPAKGSCEYHGVIKSTTPEPVHVSVTLTYKEINGKVALETSSTSSEVAINGKNTQALPSNIVIHTPYPVSYTYTNESSLDATGVTTLVNMSSGTFTQVGSTCGSRLNAHESCQLDGIIESSTPETITASVIFSYAQGSDITLESTTTSSEIAVTSDIQGLPRHTAINTEYPVIFKYTNDSDVNITGMSFNASVRSAGTINLTKDACGNTLAAHDTCEIVGTLITPDSRQPLTLHATLKYDQAISPEIGADQAKTWATEYTEVSPATVNSPVQKQTVLALSNYMKLADSSSKTSFLVHESLQEASILSFIDNEVWDKRGPTRLQVEIAGQVITLQLTSLKPSCGYITSIDAAASCKGGPERVLRLTLPESEFNKIPYGSHTINLTLSNKVWYGWNAGYQHMVKLPITFIRNTTPT